LFSTETGDAWLLDPADQLAARLARDGDPEPIHIEENDTTFATHRRPRLHLRRSRYRSALNHPWLPDASAQIANPEISNMFG
jgi:hypothetical protein